MSEVTEIVEPQAEEPAAPVELPILIHEYQPTDESGRSLGGKQVIKYTTPNELAQKLTEQNILLVRKLRETTRKQRLGIQETDEIPADAQRFDSVVEFSPRALSPEERIKLSRDILDPEHFEAASNALFEASVGATPQRIAQTLTDLQLSNLKLQAKIESDSWVVSTPEYYKCKENFETITNWMLKYDLAPIRDNFQLAYDTLKAAGLLLEAPIVREEATVPPSAAPPVLPTPGQNAELTPANSQPVQETDGRITVVEEPAQIKRPVAIPTGLTRNNTADTGAPRSEGDEIVYELVSRDGKGAVIGKRTYHGLAALDVMPADDYGRLIRDPKTRPLVERLEASRSKR